MHHASCIMHHASCMLHFLSFLNSSLAFSHLMRFTVFLFCSKHLCLPWAISSSTPSILQPKYCTLGTETETSETETESSGSPQSRSLMVPLYLLPCLTMSISKRAPPAPTFLRFWPPVLAKLEDFCLWPFFRNIITSFDNCRKGAKRLCDLPLTMSVALYESDVQRHHLDSRIAVQVTSRVNERLLFGILSQVRTQVRTRRAKEAKCSRWSRASTGAYCSPAVCPVSPSCFQAVKTVHLQQ